MGYRNVTADSISFQLVQGENGQTLVAVVNCENRTLQTDSIVRMADDTTGKCWWKKSKVLAGHMV